MSGRAGGCVPLTDAQRAEAEEYLHLCGSAADRFAKKYRHVDRGEFFSAAFDGLVDAVGRFDESFRVSMECYAPRRIAGACGDLMRAGTHGAIRVTRAGYEAGHAPRVVSIDLNRTGGEMGSDRAFVDSLLPPARTPPPDAELCAREGFQWLLGGLNAVERFVLRKVYGPDEWTLREVGDHIGLSPTRIGQIHAGALEHVRRRALDGRLGRPSGVATPDRPAGRARPHRPGRSPDHRAAWRTPPPFSFDAAGLPRYLEGLDATERRVVELRYGLTGGGPRLPAEIAVVMGRSKAWACIVLKRATGKIEGMHRNTTRGACP